MSSVRVFLWLLGGTWDFLKHWGKELFHAYDCVCVYTHGTCVHLPRHVCLEARGHHPTVFVYHSSPYLGEQGLSLNLVVDILSRSQVSKPWICLPLPAQGGLLCHAGDHSECFNHWAVLLAYNPHADFNIIPVISRIDIFMFPLVV